MLRGVFFTSSGKGSGDIGFEGSIESHFSFWVRASTRFLPLSVSLLRFSSRSLCIVLYRHYSYHAARFSFVEVDGRRRQWVFRPLEKNRGSQPYVALSCSVDCNHSPSTFWAFDSNAGRRLRG
jgi:hypothetical protein